MKIFTSTLFILSFFCLIHLKAQTVFTVLASKDCKINSTTIATGQKLSANEVITVPTEGYLALIHMSGKTIEFKEAGNFNLTELDKKYKQSRYPLSRWYFERMIKELTKVNNPEQEEYQGYIHHYVSSNYGEIKLNIPNKINAIHPYVFITWHPYKDVKDYTFILKNISDEIIIEKTVSDTSFNFNIGLYPRADNNYLITVAVKNNTKLQSIPSFINQIKGTNAEAILKREKSLQEELDTNTSSPINALIMATFYDENDLYTDAYAHYQKAVALNPDVIEYKTLFYNFLNRKLFIHSSAER
jgi:tetratricopeptide (TPR) repeat protein